jgi:UDP-N-acetylglucosamine--N-acetylmuramyl-(pentapeptide) pyrophosphoryl-undecaprenol N-acetylglucosamine transferase
MGGFTSLAPLLAGRRLKLATLLHESNAFAGKANRLSSKFCDLVLLGMKAVEVFFPGKNTSVVGTPLRDSLSQSPTREEALAFFGLSESKRTLLVMGGSQGARGVNDNILKALPLLDEEKLQVIHLTGPNELETVQKGYAAMPAVQAHVAPFCQQMEMAYAAADAAVSRSGASSLTELSAFGVPTLLIPYPHAADDHQTCNAQVYVKVNAAEMIQESELSPQKMAELLASLLTDDQKRATLRAGMLKLSPVGAADAICDAIEGICQRP